MKGEGASHMVIRSLDSLNMLLFSFFNLSVRNFYIDFSFLIFFYCVLDFFLLVCIINIGKEGSDIRRLALLHTCLKFFFNNVSFRDKLYFGIKSTTRVQLEQKRRADIGILT